MPRKSGARKHLATRPPLQRMLHIHHAVLAGKYPNCSTLARELEVSSRSIARDIDFLRDRLELPLAYHELKHGYHYTQEVSSFPTLTISEGELLALVVAEKAMQQYRGTPFEKPLVNALGKLSDTLPDTISVNLSHWNDSISFRTSAEPVVDLAKFDTLTQATARRERLELIYRKPGQKTGESRIVDPYHLANVNGEWFLFGYDHLRQAIRTYAPARIQKISRTGDKFERSATFSVERQLRGSFGVYSGSGKIEVTIEFDPGVADFIREKKWHPSQKLKVLPEGQVELTLTLSSLIEIERWILSWGGSARVIAPPKLVEAMRKAAERMLQLHSPGGADPTPAKASAR